MAPTPSNTTVPWTDHGIPGLVCTQARWSSLVLFFLANYVAHCATIKFYPAETPTELAIAVTGALLFPSSGLRRAVGAIRRRPRLRPLNKIQRALASGAMCMVVRTKDWQLRRGEIIRNMRSNAFADSRYHFLQFYRWYLMIDDLIIVFQWRYSSAEPRPGLQLHRLQPPLDERVHCH